MGREIRVVRKGGDRGGIGHGRLEPNGTRGGPGRPPPVSEPEPQSTAEARRAIEQTRGRISSTIDAIEGRISHAREEIKDRLDVVTPLRERIRSNTGLSLGVAFGAGLLLAVLTRGEETTKPRGKARALARGRGHEEPLDADEREALRHWRKERRERLAGKLGGNGMTGRGMSFGGEALDEESAMTVLGHALIEGVRSGLRDRWRGGRAGG